MSDGDCRRRAPQPDKLRKFLDQPLVLTASCALPHALSQHLPSEVRVHELSLANVEQPKNFAQLTRVEGIKTQALDPRIATLPSSNILASITDVPESMKPKTDPRRLESSNKRPMTAQDIWRASLIPRFGAPDALDNLKQEENKIFAASEATFRCHKVEASTVQEVHIPQRFRQERYLMSPAERRQALEYEVLARKARHELGAALAHKTKLERIIRHAHPRGIVGQDPPPGDATAVPASSEGRESVLQSSHKVRAGPTDHIADVFRFTERESLPFGTVKDQYFERPARRMFAGARDSSTVRSLNDPSQAAAYVASQSQLRTSSSRFERLVHEQHKGRSFDIISGAQRDAFGRDHLQLQDQHQHESDGGGGRRGSQTHER